MTNRTDEHVEDLLDTLTLPNPLELAGGEFRRTAIIGVGLIGGSIGLRLKALDAGTVVGFDRQDVLDEAVSRGAIDRGQENLHDAVREADLVVLATPVDVTLSLLPDVLRASKPEAVVTDTCPVKLPCAAAALAAEGRRGCFIGGHPLAGGSRVGVSNADACLFDNAYWLLCPSPDTPPATHEALGWWVRLLGAYPLVLDPDQHDRLMAMTSHAPFVLAIALSKWIEERSADSPLLPRLATGPFQTMTALAGLPLGLWEGVVRANLKETETALRDFRTVLDRCIEELGAGQLPESWKGAHALQRRLSRERPGDWDANCELILTVPDRPGVIARIAGLLAAHDISIRDLNMIYVRERVGGSMRLVVASRAEARRAMEVLALNGFNVRLRE